MATTSGDPVPGALCKLYYDADGDIASPTWVEVTICTGLNPNTEWTEAEIQERSPRVTTVMLCHLTPTFTVKLTRRPGNTLYDAFMNAHRNGTKLGLAAMTGTITDTGHFGYQAEIYVTAAADSQENTDIETSFTCRPCGDYDTAPSFALTT